jgi:hypothetical protein
LHNLELRAAEIAKLHDEIATLRKQLSQVHEQSAPIVEARAEPDRSNVITHPRSNGGPVSGDGSAVVSTPIQQRYPHVRGFDAACGEVGGCSCRDIAAQV